MKKEKKAQILGKAFVETHNVIYFEKHFYLYNEGIWRLESDENTEAWIATEYMKFFENEPPSRTQINEVIKYIQVYTYDRYRKAIKYINENHIANTINTKSGILNLDTLEVKAYEKEDFCFYKLPFDYIENPKCPSLFHFLTTSMNYNPNAIKPEEMEEYKKTMHFIQEWMGYTLTGGNKFQKALIMIGEGGNGKGTLQKIWTKIVGKYNCSFVDLKYINDNSQIFMTRNKLINFSKDIESGSQLDTGVVKAAVSGEEVIANEKYKGQQLITFTSKLIIACNDTPYIKNAGEAIKRRFFILPFERVFKQEDWDHELDKKLENEAEQIFSWAVNGYKNLMKRERFDPPQMCLFSFANYIKQNDSVATWIDEECQSDEQAKEKPRDLYNKYSHFCRECNIRPLGLHKFYSSLEKKGYKKLKTNGNLYFIGLKTINQTIL